MTAISGLTLVSHWGPLFICAVLVALASAVLRERPFQMSVSEFRLRWCFTFLLAVVSAVVGLLATGYMIAMREWTLPLVLLASYGGFFALILPCALFDFSCNNVRIGEVIYPIRRTDAG